MKTECWLIQKYGRDICENCSLKNKKGCTGKNIIKTGKNKSGIAIYSGHIA